MKRLCIALLIIAAAGAAFAQTGEFQRMSTTRESNRLSIELGMGSYTQTTGVYEIYTCLPQIGIGYTFGNHEVKLQQTFLEPWYNSDNAEVPKNGFNGTWFDETWFGNLVLSYDYLKQIEQLNLFLGGYASMAYPDDIAIAGSRHIAGLRMSVSGVKDPIVWNAGFQYGVGLPKEERGVQTWEPGNMQGNVGIMSMFNSIFGFGLGFIQSVRLAPFRDGDRNREETRTASVFRPEVLILLGPRRTGIDWYVRFSLDIYAYPTAAPGVFTLLLGNSVDFPKKR
jgi:hypothetical protein